MNSTGFLNHAHSRLALKRQAATLILLNQAKRRHRRRKQCSLLGAWRLITHRKTGLKFGGLSRSYTVVTAQCIWSLGRLHADRMGTALTKGHLLRRCVAGRFHFVNSSTRPGLAGL
jgi:hypothetical protein